FFMGYGGPDPLVFLQTPKEVWIVWREDNQVRRIYMNVPHSENLKASWYGESVGHYEGDTLVADTIGLNGKTALHAYPSTHTAEAPVVARWRRVAGGQAVAAVFTVEDPGAFYGPWTGMRRYRRVEQEPYEKICAENNTNLFHYHMPVAEKTDF